MATAAARHAELQTLARACTACDLHRNATQVVFGEGPVPAALMLIGEQPGDREDRAGHPFVGPAGGLLHRAATDAGLDLSVAYLTNAVKHFKWEPSGKVRVHKTPSAREVRACRPWWEAEVDVVEPEVVCCLGAVAARAVLGPDARVSRDRGRSFTLGELALEIIPTVHPSSVLRARDRDRHVQYDAFVADLRVVSARVDEVLRGR